MDPTKSLHEGRSVTLATTPRRGMVTDPTSTFGCPSTTYAKVPADSELQRLCKRLVHRIQTRCTSTPLATFAVWRPDQTLPLRSYRAFVSGFGGESGRHVETRRHRGFGCGVPRRGSPLRRPLRRVVRGARLVRARVFRGVVVEYARSAAGTEADIPAAALVFDVDVVGHRVIATGATMFCKKRATPLRPNHGVVLDRRTFGRIYLQLIAGSGIDEQIIFDHAVLHRSSTFDRTSTILKNHTVGSRLFGKPIPFPSPLTDGDVVLKGIVLTARPNLP